MKLLFSVFIFLFLLITGFAQSDSIGPRILLPNGWSLTPVGKSMPLGDLPLNIVVSPSKKYIAVTNNGQSIQSIQLMDAVNASDPFRKNHTQKLAGTCIQFERTVSVCFRW